MAVTLTPFGHLRAVCSAAQVRKCKGLSECPSSSHGPRCLHPRQRQEAENRGGRVDPVERLGGHHPCVAIAHRQDRQTQSARDDVLAVQQARKKKNAPFPELTKENARASRWIWLLKWAARF